MLLQLIFALISAVVFSGFYSGYITPNTPVFNVDIITTAAFALATLATVVLSQVFSGASADADNQKPAKSTPNKAKPSKSKNAKREDGSVKWFNVSKGFGFITRESGEDIFVHYRSIRGQGRRRLFEGQAVSFTVIDSDKGLQADDVEILS